ncbi:MAG: hypothetical protein GF320_07165, partial [Armatimonadia bacterium]|nr:hypothetical protein [Armatimonadia bacterium]
SEDGPHPYTDRNNRLYEWAADRDWMYRVDFQAAAVAGRAVIEFEAVDYRCTAWLNGIEVGSHQGASDAFRLDVTEAIQEGANRLHVLVRAAEPEPGQIGRTMDVRTWKPRFAYGWDWNCRLIPLGIWGSVRVVLDGGIRIDDLWWRSRLAEDRNSAAVTLLATVHSDEHRWVKLSGCLASGGSAAAQSSHDVFLSPGDNEVRLTLSVDQPKLWWPNGYGEPFLYDAALKVEADGLAPVETSMRVGIRDVEWIRTDGAPEDSLPYTPVVNGTRVHIRGYNWVPPDNLYGYAEPKHGPSVKLAAESHANMLRIWGGAQVATRAFYDACDEYGILVWQEFTQSSSGINNEPPHDPEYLAMATREAAGIVRKLRRHTCIIAWCGGNELMYDDWKPLGLDHPNIAALGEVADRLDPDRYYLPTSASGPLPGPDLDATGQDRMHDIHGPWTYGGPVEHYRLWDGVDALLHAEMGSPGAANLETLRTWVSEEYIWPPDETNPLWMFRGAWWITRPQVEGLFGEMDSIEPFVTASQYLHGEALRYTVEAARRRQWRCAGTLIWQLNEAYPNNTCTNVLDYELRVKPAYVSVRKAQAPVHASAQYEGLVWHGKPTFGAEIHLSSAVPDLTGCRVVAEIIGLDGEIKHSQEAVLDMPGPGSMKAFDLEWPIPGEEVWVLRVVTGHPLAAEDETTDILFSSMPEPIFGGLFDLPKAEVAIERTDDGVFVKNTGSVLALPIAGHCEPEELGDSAPLDSLFALRPGESVRVLPPASERKVRLAGFNISGGASSTD